MVDIGWFELLIVFIVVLVVLGPQRLPEMARTLALWMGRLRRTYTNFKLEIEREVGMDDVRQQLHNEQIMSEMKALEEETKSILDQKIPLDDYSPSSLQNATENEPGEKEETSADKITEKSPVDEEKRG